MQEETKREGEQERWGAHKKTIDGINVMLKLNRT